jgi:hypothetical protein
MKAISFVQPMERLSHVSIESKLHENVGGMPFLLVVVVGMMVLLRVEMFLILGTTNTTI